MTGRRSPTSKAAVRRDGKFDAFDMAARQLELSGSANAAKLPRVVDELATGRAVVAWRISGMADARGRPSLQVELDGAVPLECQRCLRTFAWPVKQRTVLLLARDESEQARLDDDDEHEVVMAAAPLDPHSLVEDELVLTLPVAPHCERGDCRVAGTATMTTEAGSSPFDALAALKSRPARKPKT